MSSLVVFNEQTAKNQESLHALLEFSMQTAKNQAG